MYRRDWRIESRPPYRICNQKILIRNEANHLNPSKISNIKNTIEEVEEEHGGGHQNVLVEHEANEIAHPAVVVPAVLQQQRAQEPKLGDGEIWRIHSLDALFAFDPHLNT